MKMHQALQTLPGLPSLHVPQANRITLHPIRRRQHKTTRTVQSSAVPLSLAAISFAAAPVGVLLGGAGLVSVAAAYLVYAAINNMGSPKAANTVEAEITEAPLSRENAVLVIGSTGRSGREVVAAVSEHLAPNPLSISLSSV
jgi:hypothetical protein